MRVLWLVRDNLTRNPGGDSTQILSTAAALRRRGLTIDFAHEVGPDLAGYDLAHLFHLDRLWENIAHSRRLRAARLPYVLSTIYWPSDEFDRGGRAGLQGLLARTVGSAAYQNLRMFQRYLLHCHHRRQLPGLRPRRYSFHKNVVELLTGAAALLPNSQAESDIINAHFGVSRPTVAVPNAADQTVFGPPTESADRNGVLCIGRIEPRKNQLALIHALRGTGIPLTLVGAPGRYSGAYYGRCRRAADASVRFAGPQPPAELRRLCHRACVHACVSWYETPGLVSLEAALCGCAIVATPGGCTREYLRDDASYGQPDDPQSLRAAVERAIQRGPSPTLAQRVATDYTWDAAANKTLEAYEKEKRGHH